MEQLKKKRKIVGLLSMIGGCFLVFWLIVAMNASQRPEKDEREPTSMAVEVPQERKPPPKKKLEEPKPRPRRRDQTAKAPPPSLTQGLSGMTFGLPRFESAGLEDAQRSVLGDAGIGAGMVMTEDTVDEPPRPLAVSSPAYPPRARARGIEGSVTLSILVGPRGEVEQVKVLSANPPGEFEQAAMEAARSWRFQPAMYKGQPVRIWARKVVSFKLT